MFTIETWVLLKSPQTNNTLTSTILSIGDSKSSRLELQVAANKYQVLGYYGDKSITATMSNVLGGWYHLALTVGTDAVKLYLDTELLGSAAGNVHADEPGSLFSINPKFIEEIAEVRIWNIVRSIADLRTFLYSAISNLEVGLVSHLPFKGIPIDQEVHRKCLLITRDDVVSLESISLDSTKLPRITVEFWLNINEDGMNSVIFDYANGAFMIHDAQHLTLVINKQSVVINPNINLIDDHWHHLAVSWRALLGYATVYLDGKEIAKTKLAKGTLLPGLGRLQLGKQPFAGRLCELRIWNAVRDEEEIRQDMFFQQVGTEPDLLAYWRMDSNLINSASFSNANGTSGNLVLSRNGQIFDQDTAVKFGAWINSGLFIRHPLTLQSKAMRDKWDSLTKFYSGSGMPSNHAPIPLQSFVNKLNQEITEARLASEQQAYSLKDVQMQLKAVPNNQGALILPDVQQLNTLKADQLTTISLNFVPEVSAGQSSNSDIEPLQKAVPNVCNYTRAIAIEKLEDAEFMVKSSYQIVTDENQIGFVVSQYPKAGVLLPALSEVTIFIGKK